MSVLDIMTDFINNVFIVIGVIFIFASLVKYMEYKHSPETESLSTIVFLLVAGLMLVVVPVIYMMTDHGLFHS